MCRDQGEPGDKGPIGIIYGVGYYFVDYQYFEQIVDRAVAKIEKEMLEEELEKYCPITVHVDNVKVERRL